MEYIKLLKKLVSYKSIAWDKQTKKNIIEYIEKLFSKEWFFVFRENIGENHNLFISPSKEVIENCKRRKIEADICTACHADVVPWDDQLFDIKEDSERFYGRGVLDMKGALSVCIYARLQNKETLQKSRKKHIMIITTDEETGSKQGIQHITKNYIISNKLDRKSVV